MNASNFDTNTNTSDPDATVGTVARLLGVSVRTLHHWDSLGVASPSGRTRAGYRAYSAADIAILQRVILLRDLEVPLGRVRFLLTADADTRRAELVRRRHDLGEKMRRLQSVGDAVDRLLEADEAGILLSQSEQERVFGDDWDPAWSTAARARWGNSAQWAEYAERSAERSADDWSVIATAARDATDALAAALRDGATPGSERANSLAERHREALCSYFHCTHSMHVIVGRMSVTDAGFAESYDRVEPGLALWLTRVIDENARAHGIDPDTAEWQ